METDGTELATKAVLAKRLKVCRRDAAVCFERRRKSLSLSCWVDSEFVVDLAEMSMRVFVFDQVLEAVDSNKTTVATIREYALREVLTKAQSRNAGHAELAAWAVVVEMTNKTAIVKGAP